MSEELRVFVYGTLKPGEYYHAHYCEGRIVACEPAIAPGKLYDLPVGYPAMTAEAGTVWGYVLTLQNASVLARLDELEDYQSDRPAEQNEYNRQRIAIQRPDGVSLGQVWGYIMSVDRVQHFGGVVVSSGNWSGTRAIASPSKPLPY
ncbi:gamma-glutamylcyclotransferase family protein [Leptolyngbya sp. AN02str]|uniref:gamma-glutamylcyclotransferase family protein n=1 Tax=Leptolyngbya sp. AN02str TaxID=3423363 RepID=UPI003D3188EB